MEVPVYDLVRSGHSFDGAAGRHPEHDTTGSRGYFGNQASLADSRQRMNVEPRSEATRWACTHVEQRPGSGGTPSTYSP